MDILTPELVGNVITLVVLAGLLLFLLVTLRIALKLTMTLFRLGCVIILILLAGIGIWLFFIG